MFVNITLKRKRRIIIIGCAIILFIAGLSVFAIQNLNRKTKNIEKIKCGMDLSFEKYYVQYDMTVISNKNINTYSVKEWHKEGVIAKLEYLDYMKNTVSIILEKNICSIISSTNLSKMVINNIYENKNIASLSTFGYFFNACNSCRCRNIEQNEDKELVVMITLNKECGCEFSKMQKELKVSMLELIIKDGIPKNYTIFDESKKEYISIVYNVYDKNIEI